MDGIFAYRIDHSSPGVAAMCINANVNFAGSAVIAAIGVATLSNVRQPRAVLFAAVPLLFALHQFTEGFVWLGMRGVIRPEATRHVTFLFMLYAQGILPFLMPLAVLLIEPRGRRWFLISALTAVGAALAAYVFYGVMAFDTTVEVENHSLAYRNPATTQVVVATVYVIVTCGALIASTHRVIMWFGVLNVIGVLGTLLMKQYAFTSVWCAYAAVASAILYWQFSNRHIDLVRPNSVLDGLRARV